jgi:hypothetical protein
MRCPALERDGDSLEGGRGWRFGGPLRLLGRGLYSFLGCGQFGEWLGDYMLII